MLLRVGGCKLAGRTICKLHLPSPGLHADINGDGVLDHVQAYGEGLVADGVEDHIALPKSVAS